MNKFLFFFKRPKVVIVVGQGNKLTKEAIFQVLKNYFKIGKEILIYETDLKDIKDFKFLIKRSRLPILVVTRVGEYHPEREFFAGPIAEISEIKKLAEVLPTHSYLILNFDDETVRDLKSKTKAHSLTFGFGVRADLRVTDIVLTPFPSSGTNFKINYQGKIVPVWLEKLFGKKHIYAALAVAVAGEVLDLNLVEISEALKNYRGLSGEMQLLKGIKNSWILDSSENTSSLSMLEDLEILGKLQAKRKIAVLGDILRIGKYTVEAHEAIGERIKGSADLLFTVGPRAKFFAQGAISRGMSEDKIFQFDESGSVGKALQDEIREGDLILVDGSKEMKMSEIITEIKALK